MAPTAMPIIGGCLAVTQKTEDPHFGQKCEVNLPPDDAILENCFEAPSTFTDSIG